MGLSFPFPFIDVLTIPTDATTGSRIVIGPGVNFEVYDGTVLMLRINESGLQILPNEPADAVGTELRLRRVGTISLIDFVSNHSGLGEDTARISEFVFGAYDQALQIAARVNEDNSCGILMAADRTSQPTLRFRDQGTGGAFTDLLQIDGGSTTADMWFDHPSTSVPRLSLPRGVVAHDSWDTNNGPHSADADTDMALNNVPVVSGRFYGVHAHSQIDLNNGPGDWLLRLRLNGADFRDLCRVQTTDTDLTITMDALVPWQPSTTQATDDLLVRADEISGTSDITLNGASSTIRTLTVLDLGAL